ncbi:MAG: hypothetical protein AAB019_11715 [Planctomycetota bacterium]
MINHRYLFIIYLGWLWLMMGILCLALAGWPPLACLKPTSLVIFLEQSKLFFLSCLLPFLFALPRNSLIYPTRLKRTYFLSPLLFLVLFSPLTVLLIWFSNVSWLTLFLQELFLFFYGGMIILLVLLANRLRFNLTRWYYLFFFLFFGAGPVFFYLRLELAGHSTNLLLTINPFWLVSRMAQSPIFLTNWLIQIIGLALIILTLLIPLKRDRKPRFLR